MFKDEYKRRKYKKYYEHTKPKSKLDQIVESIKTYIDGYSLPKNKFATIQTIAFDKYNSIAVLR